MGTPEDLVAGDAEVLTDLVGAIYDTVLDRAAWPNVLRRLSLFVPGAASAVFWEDGASQRGDVFFHHGIPEHYKALYFGEYVRRNPITVPRFFVEMGEPVATGDLVPYDEFLQTTFYREWAKPQGLVDFVSVTLERVGLKAAMFGVFRHARHGLVDEDARRRMRLLTPHIRRAVLISKLLDFKRGEAETFAETLDALRAAVILVDAGGRIVHANAAGHALLRDGRVVKAVNGRFTAGALAADARLRRIFRAAGDEAIGAQGVALPLTGEAGERHVAHILPLTSRARRQTGRTLAAVAAIFIQKPAFEAPSAPVAIAEAYGLTMTELRVLLAIVEVGGAPEVAATLGIAPSTVRTHLGRVYAKTGVARQADLVKLVAGFSSSLIA
jgi:DNA-binding CsgD family transcriptional regulator